MTITINVYTIFMFNFGAVFVLFFQLGVNIFSLTTFVVACMVLQFPPWDLSSYRCFSVPIKYSMFVVRESS
jgi:hypothetical protein